MNREKRKYIMKSEKGKTVVFIVIRAIVLLLIVSSFLGFILEQNDENKSRLIFVFIQSFALLGASFLPSILEKTWKINIPSNMEIIFILFCTASLLLGEIGEFYIKYSWWDSLLHTLSGSLIAVVGFVLINYFNYNEHYTLKINPLFCALFVFCFSITCGAIWEIFEWLIDGLNNSNMQRFRDNITAEPFLGREALRDTMKDIILDTIGAFVVAILGFIDIKIERGIVQKFRVEKLVPIDVNNEPISPEEE